MNTCSPQDTATNSKQGGPYPFCPYFPFHPLDALDESMLYVAVGK